ncbi:MAG: cupin domain-containing protein [Lachnospiraceae bacterium]|nr:cupin domain-containing protein [Lachnospiraceae bacterium]MBR6365948.1 cupin domain-containing protein [Lachnospiraceae bacterium]
MRDIIIKNVKDPGYEVKNLNQIYDPAGEHKRSYEFSKNEVYSPYRNGEGQLTVNFYTLLPGKSNYPYHQHFGKEEAFYIISGEAVLKTPKGDVTVHEGDVIVIPPNENGGHRLTNESDAPVVYLDIDTYSPSDVIVYPDSGNVRFLAGGMQKSFKLDSEVNYLDGE